MNKNQGYLFELQQLTESIFYIRGLLAGVDKNSEAYKRFSESYEKLWKEREELEEKIISKME